MTTPFAGFSVPAPDPDSVKAAVATITARDPGFNLDEFVAEAQQAFWLVGQAHEQCKPELCQTVLAPALAAREQAAIEDACTHHAVVAPRDEDASTGQLVSISADENADTAVVHFISTWRPQAGGKAKEQRRVQNWCFQRPASAQTVRTQEGQHCTNCGALLSGSSGTCRYCGAAIGSGSGWAVIRIDDVGAQEAAAAATAMRAIVGEMMTARHAGTAPTQPTQPVGTAARRRTGCAGCLPVLFFGLLVIVAAAIAGAGGDNAWHRAVAKVIPALRHPHLSGRLDLDGQLIAQHLRATQVAPKFQFKGTCTKQAVRTAWNFSAKLPDGSRFHLQIGLPPDQGGPGSYTRPKVSVSADAQNSSRYTSWTSQQSGTAALTVRADGGGDIAFTGLRTEETGGNLLAGHLTWSCVLD